MGIFINYMICKTIIIFHRNICITLFKLNNKKKHIQSTIYYTISYMYLVSGHHKKFSDWIDFLLKRTYFSPLNPPQYTYTVRTQCFRWKIFVLLLYFYSSAVCNKSIRRKSRLGNFPIYLFFWQPRERSSRDHWNEILVRLFFPVVYCNKRHCVHVCLIIFFFFILYFGSMYATACVCGRQRVDIPKK